MNDSVHDDDIGLPDPNNQSDKKEDLDNQPFGNAGQGWDEVKTTDSFSIGFDLSNQRDRIVVLGRTRSGKTVFLSRLYSECWEGKSGLRMACQSGPDHLNLMTHFAEMEKGVWPAATQGARHYTIDVTKDDYTIPMVILDYPGEVFQNAFIHEVDNEHTQELLGHIDRAIAVLIIVDPGGAMHDDSTIEKVHDDYGISKAISRVRESPGGCDIPISIVLTKCDIHAKKIMAVMDKKGMTGKGKWRKFLMEYYNSWFFSLGSRRKYKIFPVAAVRTRKDARGSLIPDLSKQHHNLLKPIIWSFDIVRNYREKEQKIQEVMEKAEKFAHFQKTENLKAKKENRSLLLFWIIVILLLGGIAWGTFAILGKDNGSTKQNENNNKSLHALENDFFTQPEDATSSVQHTTTPQRGSISEGGSKDTETREKEQARKPNLNRAKEWYEGGTLHKSTVTEWRRASLSNKTATCADFAASVDNTISMELLKVRVLQLVICIDEAVSDGSAEKLSLSTVEIAAMCIQILQNQEGNYTW